MNSRLLDEVSEIRRVVIRDANIKVAILRPFRSEVIKLLELNEQFRGK